MVDEGWGRRAADFATLAEPSSCREYVFVHSRLGLGPDHRLLDVACGSGLALELARMRGAECAGIDASVRLVEIARDRNPGSDIRVGDMRDLPWEDERLRRRHELRGIWGTTPDALAEVRRVLRPGGRVAMTVWGDVASPRARGCSSRSVGPRSPRSTTRLGWCPWGAPASARRSCLMEVSQFNRASWCRSSWSSPTPSRTRRGLASSGPAYESMQNIGEAEFLARAAALATEHVREGLPLRGEIQLFGYLGVKV